jgi:lipoprotein-anchoring transpeptidase ErfK/SrfK
VKRGILALFFVLGLAGAGTFAGVATAGPGLAGGASAAPRNTARPARPGASAQPARASAAAAKRVVSLPHGVRIAGVRVGRLAPGRAERVVAKAFARPLKVVVDRRSLRLDPRRFATAYVGGAVGRARAAKPGTNVPLVVSVRGAEVRAWAAKLATRLDREAAKEAIQLRDGKPWVSPHAYGRRLDQGDLVRRVVRALGANSRLPVHTHTLTLAPAAVSDGSPAVIVIDRAANLLHLYRNTRPWRTFRVATGQAAYPTPRGEFEIVVKWTNPWWYPPASPWAAGESPVPPGPSNPLGTRWMGLSSPGVGIHGTPHPESLGYSLSHGCIRMLIPQAEWLFERVDVGTPVFIL